MDDVDLMKIREAVLDGYPFRVIVEECDTTFVVVENPLYNEEDGSDPNLVCEYNEFVGRVG